MKTIPLSDAYAKATKGKLSADDDMIDVSDQAEMIKDNIGTDREWQSIGIHDSEGMAEIVALCHPINAALLCHAFNVLPEVVEALMASIECIEASLDEVPSEAREAMQKDVKRYRNILNKASSVPMPE